MGETLATLPGEANGKFGGHSGSVSPMWERLYAATSDAAESKPAA
jgi:hypothetical protein